jgi:hypothetical protein
MESGLSTDEIIAQFQSSRRRALALLVPAVGFFILIFAAVILEWPKQVTYGLFALCMVCSVLAPFSLRCPACRKFVLDAENGPRLNAVSCPNCGVRLSDAT